MRERNPFLWGVSSLAILQVPGLNILKATTWSPPSLYGLYYSYDNYDYMVYTVIK